MASPGQGGDLLDRCSLEIRASDGRGLGTGVLVGPSQVLTCSHVVAEHSQVDVFGGPGTARLTGATVGPRGDLYGADDLALLELDAPLPGRGVIRFTDWDRDERFGTVGFPRRGRTHARGRVLGRSDYHDWLQIDAEGTRPLEPGFSGGAVWVLAKHAAVGLVTHRDPDGVAYVITRDQIREFWPELSDGETATRCARYLSRVGTKLEAGEVRSAIAAADPAGAWRDVERYPGLLAEALCLETEPGDLAARLSAAYCRLAEDHRPEAEPVFEVLMEALPAALLSQWQIDLPEAADPEARLRLVGRVLAELALAAAEGGAADFHKQPDRDEWDEPRATHRLPGPGELGADPSGDEAAREIAEEAGARLAFDAGFGSESTSERGFLGALATGRFGRDTALFGGEEIRRDYKPAPPGALLEMLNERLAQPTFSRGRRLYLVAGDDDRSLIEGLRRHLPGLKIVTIEPAPEQIKATGKLMFALRNAFSRRRNT